MYIADEMYILMFVVQETVVDQQKHNMIHKILGGRFLKSNTAATIQDGHHYSHFYKNSCSSCVHDKNKITKINKTVENYIYKL